MSTRRLVLLTGAVAAGAAGAAVVARRDRLRSRGGVIVDGEPVAGLSGAPKTLSSVARTAAGVRGAARVAPPAWEPSVLSRLARWEPAPPRGAAARAMAYAWAAPMTAAGLVAGLTSGARPSVRRGVLVFAGARGPAGAFLASRGFNAFALGHVVVSRTEPSEALLTHELIHVRQAERFGPVMAPLYLALHVLYGYARHPMERAARRAQRRALGVPES